MDKWVFLKFTPCLKVGSQSVSGKNKGLFGSHNIFVSLRFNLVRNTIEQGSLGAAKKRISRFIAGMFASDRDLVVHGPSGGSNIGYTHI